MSSLTRTCLSLLILLFATPAWSAPRIVVSILPLHSLVAGVTEGVAEPVLLLRGGTSPHDYSLRPSDIRNLTQADLVIWTDPGLEGFLVRTLDALPSKVRRTALAADAALLLLPARSGGLWEEDHHHDHHHHDHGEPDHDPHVWLSPENARRIVRHVASLLSAMDPDNALRYGENRDRLLARIDALDLTLKAQLERVAARPYIVFHDAYQYFEASYGLAPAGAVIVDPARPPGARRVRDIRNRILEGGAVCVFSEPQFEPALVRTLTEGTGARTGVLDPVGAALEPGENAWFHLMEAMGDALADCLTE